LNAGSARLRRAQQQHLQMLKIFKVKSEPENCSHLKFCGGLHRWFRKAELNENTAGLLGMIKVCYSFTNERV